MTRRTFGPTPRHTSSPLPTRVRGFDTDPVSGIYAWEPGDGTHYDVLLIRGGLYQSDLIALVNIAPRAVVVCDLSMEVHPDWLVEDHGYREYDARVLCTAVARILEGT